MEQNPELSKSPEQKATKSEKINVRKSLAWDNAFFTSEGVLNAEELAIVNSQFRKGELHSLPGIEEDIRKSTESSSTLDNDIWELETLEVDVFENLRASIQKSFGKCDKASNLVISKKSTEKGELNASNIGPLKKVGVSSQNKLNPHNASRRHAIIKQRPEDTKEALVHGKRSIKDAGGIGDSKSSLKPPRIAPRSTTLSAIPGKKASTSGPSQSNGANRQSVAALKRVGELRSAIPRSIIPSPKSVSGSSVSSDLSRKYPLEDSSKRVARSTTRSSSKPMAKTLLRTSKSKTGSSNADNLSMLKLSSCASPTSSIDSMVSAYSFSSESLSAGSSSSPSLPCRETPDHSRSFITNSAGENCFKPSGLRMPTPKVGYFDAEKSLVLGSRKVSQSGVQNNLPKNSTGTGNAAGANKLKPNKLPFVRSATQGVTMNPDSPETRSPRLSSLRGSKPSPPSMLHRLSKPAEVCGTPRSVNNDFSPISREDGHLEVLKNAAAVSNGEQTCNLNSEPMTTTLNGSESAFSGSCTTESHSDLRTSQKENLLHSGNTSGLVELIGDKISSLCLLEAKCYDGGELIDLGPRTRTPLADKSPQLFDS